MAGKSSADQLADSFAEDVEDDQIDDDANLETDDDEGDNPDLQEVETEGVNEDELDPAIRAILKKNRDAVRTAEKKLRQAERQLRGKPNDTEAAAEVTAKADKFRGLVVKQAARAALLEAGLQGVPDRFVRMIDLNEVEVDDDGNIDGLDEQIDEIKQDFADLFVAKEAPRRRRTAGDGAPREAGRAKKSSAEILAERAGLV